MGFSFEEFEKAAAKKFGGLQIDDGPNGPIVLRSVVRLKDAEADKLDALTESLKNAQSGAGGKPTEVRAILVDILSLLADNTADMRAYLRRADLAIIMAIYEAFIEQTGASEGN